MKNESVILGTKDLQPRMLLII